MNAMSLLARTKLTSVQLATLAGTDIKTVIAGTIILAFWGSVIYVAAHFIIKYW